MSYRPSSAATLLLSFCCALAPIAWADEPTTMSWPAYGGGPGGSAQQITAANIASLAVAWVHRSGDVRAKGAGTLSGDSRLDSLPKSSFMATPIATGGHWAAPTDASDQLIAYALPRK